MFCGWVLKWWRFVTSSFWYGMAGPGAAEALFGQTRWGRGCSRNCRQLWLLLLADSSVLFLLQLLSHPPPSSLISFISLFYLSLTYPCALLYRVSLCPCCALSMPVLLGAHHLLPASLGQQLQTGRGTETPPALEHPPAILVQLLNTLVALEDVSLTKYSLI